MKSIAKKELTIGFWVIVALVVLFIGINFLKGVNMFKAANYFYASYTSVEGLAQSAPVTLNGYKIGIVREISYDYDNPGHVVVELSLDKKLKIPYGTEALITSDLLGTASIALNMGNPTDGYYAVGDTITSGSVPGLVQSLSDGLMPSITGIMVKIDTLLTGVNAIVADPALTAGVHRIDDITAELNASIRSLHAILNAMQPIAADLKSITGNADTIAANFADVSRTINAAPIDSLIRDLHATIINLQQLTAELNNPNGTIGRVANDPALYDNLNATAQSLDSLLTDIKANPKRYINIKVF